MSLRPQIPVRTSESDATLSFIRQMGVENVSLMLKPDEINREVLQQQKEKLARFGMTISDAACNELQKNKSIHLNLPDRDFQIERFNNMLRVLGEEKIPFTSIAWQPNGILRTDHRVGQHTRGGNSAFCDQARSLPAPTPKAEPTRRRRSGKTSPTSWKRSSPWPRRPVSGWRCTPTTRRWPAWQASPA